MNNKHKNKLVDFKRVNLVTPLTVIGQKDSMQQTSTMLYCSPQCIPHIGTGQKLAWQTPREQLATEKMRDG